MNFASKAVCDEKETFGNICMILAISETGSRLLILSVDNKCVSAESHP